MSLPTNPLGLYWEYYKDNIAITNASPAVFTAKTGGSTSNHGLGAGTAIKFSTTGVLPTGLTAGATYYVISEGLTSNAFEVSATVGGSAINTSSAGSGTHAYRKRLSDLPQFYNMLFLFQADPVGGTPGTDGSVSFTYPTTAGGTSADIATCTARGQNVILSIGGAGAQLTLGDKTRSDALYTSIVSINNTLAGYDTGSTPYISGVDFNIFEGEIADGPWMTYVALRLKDKYGSNFLITAPVAASTAQLAGDRAAMVEMYQGNTEVAAGSTGEYAGSYTGRALDWFCPQFYDDTSLTDTDLITTRLGTSSSGFRYPVTVNAVSTQIPANFIGIGFSIGTHATNDWTVDDAVTAYNAKVTEGLAPKGAYNFSDTEDPTSTFFGKMTDAMNGYTPTTQEYLSRKVGNTIVSSQLALNNLAGTTGLTSQEAANIYAGTTGLSVQNALNARASQTGLQKRQIIPLL